MDGDRESTMRFEKYFREKAETDIAVYFEVIFWKLYSLISRRNSDRAIAISDSTAKNVDNWIEFMKKETKSSELHKRIKEFSENPTLINFQDFRVLLGMNRFHGSLALASTFPAFVKPEDYPILDSHVVSWVNSNYAKHGEDRENKLTMFSRTSPSDGDFQSYMNWVLWCRDSAKYLREKTDIKWRARDVEMAVFSADINGYELEVLRLPP